MALAEFFIDMELSDFLTERRELVAVVAAKITGGERTSNPLDATDTLQLDPDSVQVLTEQVVDGELQWQAPAGDWAIIATYLMPSGEAPTLVAAEYPGYVIDHLDAVRVLMSTTAMPLLDFSTTASSSSSIASPRGILCQPSVNGVDTI